MLCRLLLVVKEAREKTFKVILRFVANNDFRTSTLASFSLQIVSPKEPDLTVPESANDIALI
jgi:hypothetical protein